MPDAEHERRATSYKTHIWDTRFDDEDNNQVTGYINHNYNPPT